MKKQGAFTLLELLIVLSIIAVVAAFALSPLQLLISKQDNAILQDTIIRMIQAAQNQAIATSKPIALALNQKDTIDIFTDDYHDGVIHQHSQRILSEKLNVSHGELHIRSFPYYRTYLLFSGIFNDNATITYYAAGASRWSVVVSQTGRVRVETSHFV